MPLNMTDKQRKVFHKIRKLWLHKLLPLNGLFAGDLILKFEMPKQEAFDDCKVLIDRKLIIANMKKQGVVAEVGTQEGFFAEYILKETNPVELHLFDIDLEPLLRRKGQTLDKDATLHSGDSSVELGKFEDEYFDWIYIDGDHEYSGVKRDIEVAKFKVKKGGYLVFNDFTIWSPIEMIDYGIPYAVCELINEHDWKVEYFALHALGYHDIALRRPF